MLKKVSPMDKFPNNSSLDKEIIDDMIVQVYELGQNIKKMDKFISELKDENLKEQFNVDLLNMCDEYYEEVNFLEVCIQEYIEDKKQKTGTIDLPYKKLLKQLKRR